MTSPTWNDVADELAGRLSRLRDRDALSLDVGNWYVQFKLFGKALSVIASGVGPGVEEKYRVGAEQSRQMLALGWQPPDEYNHILPDLPYPATPEAYRRLADLFVVTVRDVFGAATPAAATFRSHNDGGQRAPTLTTVAMNPDQEPEPDLDPATILPAADPTWRRYLETIRAGVGGWSRAEVEAVLAALPETASARETYADDGQFADVSVRERVPAAESHHLFRSVLAAAVAVLGDPPLVGGPGAFARWRGDRLTVIVSHDGYPDTATVRLTVCPTDVIESEEYLDLKYSPDQRPEHDWITRPDTDKPESRTLDGMMFASPPPPGDLDELDELLRRLFGSFARDLPLLYPYASNASFRFRGPNHSWPAHGEFTHERVRVAYGMNSSFETHVLAGAGTGTDVADGVMRAFREAGVTAPDQLDLRVWSATPAESLDALGLGG